MKLISVDCNSCGAPLEVGQETRFVTCRYCSKRLEIQHSESSVYTEVLDEIKESTDKISQDMEVIKLQNQLEQLDREWLLERERFMVTTKSGGRQLPTASVTGVSIFSIIFAVIWTGLAFYEGAPFPFVLFGLVFVGVSVYIASAAATKSENYQHAIRRYQVQRSRLQQELRREERR